MKERILVADDEQRMRELIAAYLKKEGYDVVEAGNGAEALYISKNQTIHLIILDVMMPVMDGFSVCTELRRTSNIPIIFLTARGENEDKILGFELGVDSYITKPFEMRLLIANVKSLIKRAYYSDSQLQKELYFDGLRINELSHTVSLDDKALNLSPKEYELLLYFALNKEIVLTRQQILDFIWGIDFYGDIRTIDSHVQSLREKLKDRAYLISTVRGVGYKFSGTY